MPSPHPTVQRALTRLVLLLTLSLAVAACDDGGEEPTATTWTATFPALDTLDAWLLSTHGVAGQRYAVGGSPQQGLVLFDDGGGWQTLDVGVEVPLLNWVYALAPDDVYVVGNAGTVLHFDGATWRLEPTPTDQDLWGVWGDSNQDLWAVGGQGRMEGQATALRKQAGGAWQAVELPTLERPAVYAFFKVWGSAHDDVYIVGQRGAVLHFDGTALTELAVGTAEDLISLWGTGPDRIAIVGGRNNGVVVTFDGQQWRSQSLAPLPGLNGVWMRDPQTIHIAGQRGTVATLDFDALEPARSALDTMHDLHAIWAGDDARATTVGGNLNFIAGPYEGVLFERTLGPDE